MPTLPRTTSSLLLKLWLVLLVLLVLASTPIVHAFPSHPGTCDMTQMATVGHQASLSQCVGCYTLSLSHSNSSSSSGFSTFAVTLNGPRPVKGLLLYAVDSATGERFGSFETLPKGLEPMNCGGVGGGANTIGHITSAFKNMPMELQWSDLGYAGHANGGVWSASIVGIAVIDFSHWYYISAVQFASSTTGNATSPHVKPVVFDEITGSLLTKDETESLPTAPEANTILNDTHMFIIAVMVTLALWLSGSWIEHLLRRQESVARAEARERKKRKERARIGNGSSASRASRATTIRG